MNNIRYLINKYYKKDGKNMTATPRISPAERTSTKYHKKIRLEAKKKHRYLLFQELLKEIPFHLNKTQTKQIEYWIGKFNDNFKNFHRRSSEKTILLAFIMIQRKQTNPKIRIEKYSICNKYNLTSPVFELIQNRLIFELMRTTPMTYLQSKQYDHNILMNEGL
jgi:hypothetical protein